MALLPKAGIIKIENGNKKKTGHKRLAATITHHE
jgi:hypothetical protein